MANVTIDLSNRSYNKGFTYSDLKVPVSINTQKRDYDKILDVESIRNGIRNIFSWRQGERILLPEFGNPLYHYLYKEMNNITTNNLKAAVLNMFKWEPRVSVKSIDVVPFIEERKYEITAVYEIPALNETDVITYVINLTA